MPGAAAGLEAVHQATVVFPGPSYSSRRSSSPATGVAVTRPQAHLHAILDLILRHADEGRRIYSRADGTRLQPGDTLRLPDLGETLEQIAAEGAAALYRGELADGDRAHASRTAAAGSRRRIWRRTGLSGASRCGSPFLGYEVSRTRRRHRAAS